MEWARRAAQRSYARTRLFGSLGFVVVAQGLGAALWARGDRSTDRLMPLATVACVAGYALLLNLHGPAPSSFGADAPPSSRSSPLRSMLALLGNAGVVWLFALCAVHWRPARPIIYCSASSCATRDCRPWRSARDFRSACSPSSWRSGRSRRFCVDSSCPACSPPPAPPPLFAGG